MNKIITAPHPTLRQESKDVVQIDKKVFRLLNDLQNALVRKKNPPGVGLSLPQIGHNLNVFATLLPDKNNRLNYRVFINPKLIAASENMITRHPGDKEDVLEGCLSVPSLYAVVARPEQVEFSFYTIENGKLIEKTEVFRDFPGRVMQHELDHLQGVLFTDYLIDSDAPVFLGKNSGLEEIDKKILNSF
ncbi:MAG: peptide deformylase [Pseudomonadales bacterium]|jgi:peptide deformylase|nr:peptide deformylase [Pseudomonadales bacterium]